MVKMTETLFLEPASEAESIQSCLVKQSEILHLEWLNMLLTPYILKEINIFLFIRGLLVVFQFEILLISSDWLRHK